MNFAGVKAITIPEGDVRSIAIGGVTVWQKPNPLPYDAEVEYVETDGSQYVDTGVAPGNNEIDWDMTLAQTNAGSVVAALGCRNEVGYTTSSYAIYFRSNAGAEARIDVANNGSARYAGFPSGAACDLSWNSSRRLLAIVRPDFTPVGYIADAKTACNYAFALGGINTAGTVAFGAALKVYSATFSRAGALVRDFVPVRVGQVGYLYDRANPTGGPSGNGLYGSATSTPLVAGPDKGTTSTTAMTITESTD